VKPKQVPHASTNARRPIRSWAGRVYIQVSLLASLKDANAAVSANMVEILSLLGRPAAVLSAVTDAHDAAHILRSTGVKESEA
jgi:hypothetical protein